MNNYSNYVSEIHTCQVPIEAITAPKIVAKDFYDKFLGDPNIEPWRRELIKNPTGILIKMKKREPDFFIEMVLSLSEKGVGGVAGNPCSEEQKRQISIANLGSKRTPAQRKFMSESCKGRIPSAEHRANQSKAALGRKASAQAKINMSKAHMGKKASAQAKINMSKAQLNKTYRHSVETRLAIGAGSKGHVKSIENRQKLSKSNSGRKHFTNGTINKFLKPTDLVPVGFYPGRTVPPYKKKPSINK